MCLVNVGVCFGVCEGNMNKQMQSDDNAITNMMEGTITVTSS